MSRVEKKKIEFREKVVFLQTNKVIEKLKIDISDSSYRPSLGRPSFGQGTVALRRRGSPEACLPTRYLVYMLNTRVPSFEDPRKNCASPEIRDLAEAFTRSIF